MLHGKNFATVPKFRDDNFDPLVGEDHHASGFPAALDRPLVAQFCGDDPDVVVAAARHLEDAVDAVDLNLGCPQKIARKGHYGAYLLREPGSTTDERLRARHEKKWLKSQGVPLRAQRHCATVLLGDGGWVL